MLCVEKVQTVRPFVTLRTRLLWPRLTSAAPSSRLTTRLARRQNDRPLRVRRLTFLPYTRRIYADPVRMTSGFESIGPLAHRVDASYAVRVPRARSLPSASFRFRFAADTLAVRLGVPVIKASTGTYTRQVNSRLTFAHRLQRQIMTLRVMPDAPKRNRRPATEADRRLVSSIQTAYWLIGLTLVCLVGTSF